MWIRRGLARSFWRLSRWSPAKARISPDGAEVLIGAPHTSNWDFVLMIMLAWHYDISVRWIGKASLFTPPFGTIMRALGGIPVDREQPGRLVTEVVELLQAGERFYLVITPEGTRSPVPYWKSGFYRIARATGLSVRQGYVDRRRMITGLGPTLRLSGDVGADMDVIRAFYVDKIGVRPRPHVAPRLRDESGRQAGRDEAGPGEEER